jgi:hypothetical protein
MHLISRYPLSGTKNFIVEKEEQLENLLLLTETKSFRERNMEFISPNKQLLDDLPASRFDDASCILIMLYDL